MRRSALIIFIAIALLMIGTVASAGWWELRIDFAHVNPDKTKIYIKGANFNIPKTPVVTLGDDPTPLTLIRSTRTIILAELPPLSDCEYVLKVATANYPSHQDTYDLTIGAAGACQECGNGVVEDGEQCDDGNNVNGDGCDAECLIEEIRCNGVPTSNISVCTARGACVAQDTCLCEEGYYGNDCQFAVQCGSKDWDDPNVCSGNGECDVQTGMCECYSPDWAGPDCNDFVGRTCGDLRYTDDDVCSGIGDCVGQDECECDDGYDPVTFCQEEITCGTKWIYAPDVCGGPDQGECNVETGVCTCEPGYEGVDCEIPSAEPVSCFGYSSDSARVCSGHGACVSEDRCLCDPGEFGSLCQRYGDYITCNGIPNSDPNACSGNGACTSQDSCSCELGYVGTWCEDLNAETCNGLDPSDPLVCSGKGTCVGFNECECDPNWSGNDCESNSWTCYGKQPYDDELDICNGRGSCVAQDVCECNEGWQGLQCDFQPSGVCSFVPSDDPNVCNGRGVCVDSVCYCEGGFVGQMCENMQYCDEIDMYDANVCSGRGICDRYDVCVCSAGWGRNCENEF